MSLERFYLTFFIFWFFRSAAIAAELADGSNQGNTTEVVRYIKRRKFGRKRRSIYVKCRVSNKNEVIITNGDDEHSQEYISRRRPSNIDESTKEEEEEEEMIPVSSPPKPSSKQPTFKQLTIDQFLKKIPPTSSVIEKAKPEKISEISPKDNNNEETMPKVENDNIEELHLSRRTKRLSKSETDLTRMGNGIFIESSKKSDRKYIFRKSKMHRVGQ